MLIPLAPRRQRRYQSCRAAHAAADSCAAVIQPRCCRFQRLPVADAPFARMSSALRRWRTARCLPFVRRHQTPSGASDMERMMTRLMRACAFHARLLSGGAHGAATFRRVR